MSRKIKYILVAVLTLVFSLCIAACGSDDENDASRSGSFSLSSSELTVLTGETKSVIVNYEDQPYNGAISWVSENVGIATVKQGLVKGIKAGETNVKAIFSYNKENYSLLLKVSVSANITADLNLITAYCGGGDVDITATAAELPTGAAGKATKISGPTGADLTSLLKKTDKNEYISNAYSAPLAEGIYTIDYDLTSVEASGKTQRTVKVIKAESISDLLVLDPIDGSEPISGKVMENNLEPSLAVMRDNPGEYVTYTADGNTGYTAENGLNQNLSEFKASLALSGYTGLVDNATVYRMYGKKSVLLGKTPWFNFNLPYTANSLWTNLDDLPDSATIDVWVRGWFRKKGTSEYKPSWTSGSYGYKMLADDRVQMKDSTTTYLDGYWTKLSYPIGSNRELLNGAKNLTFTGVANYYYDKTERNLYLGEWYYEIYSVELNLGLGDSLSTYSGKVDKWNFGYFSGLFDNEEISLKRNGTPYPFNENDTVPNGIYDITYTLKNGANVFETIDKMLFVGAVNTFSSTNETVKNQWWMPGSEGRYISKADLIAKGVGVPSDSAFSDSGKGAVAIYSTSDTIIYGINVGSWLNDPHMSDATLLSLYVYAPAAKTGSYQYAQMYVSDGQIGARTGTSGKSYPLDSGNCGQNWHVKNISLTPGAWNRMEMSVADIKAIAKNSSTNYDLQEISVISLRFSSTQADAEMYYYSFEIDGYKEVYGIEKDDSCKWKVNVKSTAVENEIVNVSVSSLPEHVSVINVYDGNNNVVKTLGLNGGTFIMPAGDVTIKMDRITELPEMCGITFYHI